MKKRKKHLNIKKEQAKMQKCNVLIQLDTYSKYYDKGSISQDVRFGNVAFQGLTFTGSAIEGPNASTFSFQSIEIFEGIHLYFFQRHLDCNHYL